jgi:predicted metal-dependent hydrolase
MHDATYPLLGEPWRMALKPTGEIEMTRRFIDGQVEHPIAQLTPRQIEKFVMTWYSQQAIACFKQRIDKHAQALSIPAPPFRLSRAKTRWGSCNSRGLISLNWHLIQLPLHLIDYVVAHELAVVESVCPEYRVARRELKEMGL